MTTENTSSLEKNWDNKNLSQEPPTPDNPPPHPPTTSTPTQKTKPVKQKFWGVSSVILTFIIFLVIQTGLGIAYAALLVLSAFTVPESEQPQTENELIDSLTQIAPPFLLLSSLIMYITWLGCMWFVTKTRGKNSFKLDFKLDIKKYDPLIGAALGGIIFLFLFGIQFIFSVLEIDISSADNGSIFTNLDFVWFLILGVGIAIIAGPIAEELFFRGFILQGLFNTIERRIANKPKRTFLKKQKNVIAVVVSSLLFGLLHSPANPTQSFGVFFLVAATGLIGAILAICTIKYGRLGPAIFAHIFYNFATIFVGLALSQ